LNPTEPIPDPGGVADSQWSVHVHSQVNSV